MSSRATASHAHPAGDGLGPDARVCRSDSTSLIRQVQKHSARVSAVEAQALRGSCESGSSPVGPAERGHRHSANSVSPGTSERGDQLTLAVVSA